MARLRRRLRNSKENYGPDTYSIQRALSPSSKNHKSPLKPLPLGERQGPQKHRWQTPARNHCAMVSLCGRCCLREGGSCTHENAEPYFSPSPARAGPIFAASRAFPLPKLARRYSSLLGEILRLEDMSLDACP